MSTWKTAVGTFVALAGMLGLLAATGVVKVGRNDGDGDGDGEGADGGEADEGGASAGRKRRRGKRRKGRRRKGKKGDLDSLGYIGAVEIRPEDAKKVGVTKHVPEQVAGALNLFNPCAWGKKYRRAAGGKILREAQLIDMHGKVLHRWQTDFASDTIRGWALARLSDDGYLYAVNARTGFVKLDWDSKTVWGLEGGYHHDFAFGPDGNIWVLYEKKREITHGEDEALILDNGFAVITPDGEVLREMSLYDQLADDEHFVKSLERRIRKRGKDKKASGRAWDIFHANTLDFLHEDSEGNWQKGDIITAIRELDMVAVFDPKTMKLEWKWGPGTLDRPHDPSLLDDGHILVFDNGMHRKWSKVLEIDPLAGNKDVWSYRGTDAEPFFSSMRGLAQRLPNDNILISSSQQGKVIEVDREGNIVWEFWSTYVLGGKLRVPIRMLRLEGEALAFAKQKLAASDGD